MQQWRTLLLPIAQLNSAVLGLQPADSNSSSSSSSSRVADVAAASAAAAYTSEVEAANASVLTALNKAGLMLGEVPGSELPPLAVIAAADPVGAACLMQLLHLQLAWAVQAVHRKLKGLSPVKSLTASSSSSSSSRSRRQGEVEVPSYHEQYLAAIGAPVKRLLQRSGEPTIDIASVVRVSHAQVMLGCYGCSSSSSSAAGVDEPASWRSLQAAAAVASPEQALLMIEAALLEPIECRAATVYFCYETTLALEQHGRLEAAVQCCWHQCCTCCRLQCSM
jgi:hypothetical protein